LRTHYKMGLQRIEGPPFDARLSSQGTDLFYTPYPIHTARPAVPPHHAQLWSQDATHGGGEHFPPLDKEGKRFIQEVCGTFLFYARGIDGGILPALSALALQQAQRTENTMKFCKLFLDYYMASQEEAVLTYKASDMVLAVHSDALYLSKPKARSRAGGYMFMSANDNIPTNNGAVLNISQIIRAVMSSAAKAKLGSLFINVKTAVSMCHTLEELGHPQPQTPIQTDNKTANDLLTNKIMPKALKAMDMRFHWLRCRNAQGQFRYYWRPGTQNLADYFTKHHPASHHKASMPTYLTSSSDPQYNKLFLTSLDTKSTVTIPTQASTTSMKSFVKSLLKTERFGPVPEQKSINAPCA
jgi:hypothetical protein